MQVHVMYGTCMYMYVHMYVKLHVCVQELEEEEVALGIGHRKKSRCTVDLRMIE
jgi:hypothetical protein